MSSFRRNAEAEGHSSEEGSTTAASSTGVSSFYNFPTLGRLFEGTDTKHLPEVRARLTRTLQDLERVQRQGTSDDAVRAADAAKAYGIVLSLLDSLEEIRRSGRVTPSP